MPEFVRAADLSDLPIGACATVTVDGKDIALFNVDGEVFAIDDSCLHMGASLGSGRFQGKIVTCRAHGLRFNVTTGNIVGNDAVGVEAHPVKIQDGAIFVAAN